MTGSAPVLEAKGLVAGYVAEVDILCGVDVRVDAGEIVTIVGPNGAGKSTLVKAVCGLLPPRQGKIALHGKDICGLKPHTVVRRGVGYVGQLDNVFPTMTVEENLELGAMPFPDCDRRTRQADMLELFPALRERRRQPAGTLSGGERQMVAMAGTLMPAPKVLLLDEPSAGLAPAAVDAMFEKIADVNRAGVTILMVEQNARRALAMSHRGYVLDLGQNRFSGDARQLLADPKVAELYLGAGAMAACRNQPTRDQPHPSPVDEQLRALSATQLGARIHDGELTPPEAVTPFLHATADEHLNVIITDCAERAFERARHVDPSLPLAGIPVVVKDMFDTGELRTTYGSRLYADNVPTRTAAAVAALEQAGAIVTGKANADEFSWGTTCQNPHYGTVVNPVYADRVAGGSSGGNAAALARGLCVLALGTDTGGSVRVPAACCRVVGFKPNQAALPREGVFPLAPTMDTVGIMARSVADCALLYAALTGSSPPAPTLGGRRIGVLTSAPSNAVALLERLGAALEEVELPLPQRDPYPYFAWQCARSHDAIYPRHRERYGSRAREKWDAAARVTHNEAAAAQTALNRWRSVVAKDVSVDVMVGRTLGTKLPAADCQEPNVRTGLTAHTRIYNYLDWPAIAVGDLQLAGADSSTVLAAALAFEAAGGAPVPPRPFDERASRNAGPAAPAQPR